MTVEAYQHCIVCGEPAIGVYTLAMPPGSTEPLGRLHKSCKAQFDAEPTKYASPETQIEVIKCEFKLKQERDRAAALAKLREDMVGKRCRVGSKRGTIVRVFKRLRITPDVFACRIETKSGTVLFANVDEVKVLQPRKSPAT